VISARTPLIVTEPEGGMTISSQALASK